MSSTVNQPFSVIYLALGTNLGDRPANLREAIAALTPAVTVQAESPVYETPPWGYADQPAFLNMALTGKTHLSPQKLLEHLKNIETALGRLPTFRYGPRKIDIDILFYDDLVLETPELTLPHPHLHERAFVLIPLADLAAEHVHPILGKSVGALLAEVDQKGIHRYG